MIITIYKCDLCNNELRNHDDGFHLQGSGDGAISFIRIDDTSVKPERLMGNNAIICRRCAKGLRYAVQRIPKSIDGEED